MATKFINRKNELAWLEKAYQQSYKEGQLLVVYGKRRVGKTELITHFIKSKPNIYYLANRTTASEHLASATKVFATGFGDDFLANTPLPSWREFFDYLIKKVSELKSKEPIVLVFDEFPYLAESNEGVSSYFQYGWDMGLKDSKVVMIVMGSSIAMMYKHALIKSAPLYGRRTGQWLLEPFTFMESKNFYPKASFDNAFSLYAITGGIPAYAKVFDGLKSLKENITEKVFPEGSFLSVEPEFLLSDEFDDSRSYLTILQAIGQGRTKFSQILQDSGMQATSLPTYLQNLQDLRLVKREVPITDIALPKSKNSTYSLSDNFLSFYFSFVFPNNSLVKSKAYDVIFKTKGEVLTSLVAKAYENATPEFVAQAVSKSLLPNFELMGRWWDKDTELDLVGLNREENAILFGETKWNSKPIGTEVLNELKAKSKKVVWGKPGRKEYFVLTSKSGFTRMLLDEAKKQGVVLIQEDRVV